MKTKLLVFFLALAGLVVYLFFNARSRDFAISNSDVPSLRPESPMEIFSQAFGFGQAIPDKYSCRGDNVNPPLEFKNVPAAAKTLVLIMEDPDAPGGTWVHWALWNISAETKNLAENSVPEKAVQGMTGSGQNNYGGPCPPSGIHRYFFKLYALDDRLTIPSFSEVKSLEAAMNGHVLAKAELMGLFGR